jgi:hypothetical protein
MDLYSNQLKLNASLIGSILNNAVDWSREDNSLPIHSVFKRVVNIKTQDGLISVVTKSIGKSASYTVIDQEIDFLETGIKAGDLVKTNEKCLIFNSLIVDMSNAQVLNDIVSRDFRWEKSKIDFENLIAFKSSVDRYSANNSAWEKLHCDRDFNERIQKLKGKNPYEAVKYLIGLGPGLTPTGDDVLLGFLSIVNTCDDFISIREVFNNEILSNLKCTSDISGYFLKMAAENHYHEYVQNVIYSMVHGLPESVSISVKKLLNIGATSGTDIAIGMYLGFSV